jgi:hypothetical protein
VKVRLTRKLAEMIDGVDLSGRRVGDVLDITRTDADLLIAEGWAEPYFGGMAESAVADVRRFMRLTAPDISLPGTRTLDQLRTMRDGNERRYVDHQERRRFEDEVREELRDSRARTVINDMMTPNQAARFSSEIRAVADRLGRRYSQLDTSADRAQRAKGETLRIWQPQLFEPGTTRWVAARRHDHVWHMHSMPEPMI